MGSVLRNWPHVFSILNLFEKPSVNDPTASTARSPPVEQASTSGPQSGETNKAQHQEMQDEDDQVDEQEPLPLLVRLQYDKYRVEEGAQTAGQ